MKYKIFGIGGAARSILNALILNNFSQDEIFHFNSAKAGSIDTIFKNKYIISGKDNSDLSSRLNPEIGKLTYYGNISLFQELVQENCFYIIVGGFGGSTFSSVSVELCRILEVERKKFIIIGTYPFSFEGKFRKENSNKAIEEIKTITENLILIKNDSLRELFGDLKLSEAFQKSNNVIVEILKEILFEYDSIELKDKNKILQGIRLNSVLLEIKHYIRKNTYLISTSSSKIIIPDNSQKLLSLIIIDPKLVFKIPPRKFEELLAYIYELCGYKIELTTESHDGGVDLLVWSPPPVLGNDFLTIIQAKRYNEHRKVGSKEIRELLGTRFIFNADRAQLISTSDFTKAAKATAFFDKIDLIKFTELNDRINRQLLK